MEVKLHEKLLELVSQWLLEAKRLNEINKATGPSDESFVKAGKTDGLLTAAAELTALIKQEEHQ